MLVTFMATNDIPRKQKDQSSTEYVLEQIVGAIFQPILVVALGAVVRAFL